MWFLNVRKLKLSFPTAEPLWSLAHELISLLALPFYIDLTYLSQAQHNHRLPLLTFSFLLMVLFYLGSLNLRSMSPSIVPYSAISKIFLRSLHNMQYGIRHCISSRKSVSLRNLQSASGDKIFWRLNLQWHLSYHKSWVILYLKQRSSLVLPSFLFS
jgi:hypothetical protein